MAKVESLRWLKQKEAEKFEKFKSEHLGEIF